MSKPTKTRIVGQPAWRMASDRVEIAVTATGGHMAPVSFRLGRRTVQPLHIAPWAEQSLPRSIPTMLRVLRGDFFCMPFGGNETPYRGERHPQHGQTAASTWSLDNARTSNGVRELRLKMKTTVRPAAVSKLIRLQDGQTAVYQRHVISGGSGAITLGHHAMLQFGETPEAGLVSTSPIRSGWTTPIPFEDPAEGGYALLKPGVRFRSLTRVPTITGEPADLTRYPARRGFEDLVMLVNRPADLAWTAVVFPRQRYAWFALKDPRVLPQTILWMSNGGRHYAPWNSRHVGVMGLEEVCAWFHYGLAESVKAKQIDGTPTFARLSPRRPTVINYIMGVVAVPPTFGPVRSIRPSASGQAITLTDAHGHSVQSTVDVGFLYEK